MMNVSAAFRQGLQYHGPNAQRILFRFTNGTMISNEDIDIDSGVDFDEIFCSETDLTIGLTPSSEISFGLMNKDGHWTNFTFGTFDAYCGVLISETANGSATARRPALTLSGNILSVNGNGYLRQYELCKWGRFIAPRPAVVRKKMFDVSANDQMTLFDKDMPTKEQLGITYPITAGNMLRALCGYVGVSAVSYSFINSDLELEKEPSSFSTSTMREVVGWIAEAAGSIARFNRDGALELAWFNTTGKSYSETDYTEFEPCWYANPAITKLHIRNEDSTEELTIGSGSSGYIIQNNPFLRQDDSEDDEDDDDEGEVTTQHERT